MFNVAVIRLKDLVRYIFIITVVIAIMIFAKRYINYKNLEKLNVGQKVSGNVDKYMKKSIDLLIPEIEKVNNYENQNDEKKENITENFRTKLLNNIINLQLSAFNIKEDKEINKEKNEKNEKEEIKEEKENLELAKTNVKSTITTKNPIADSYTLKYKGVKIKNETNYDLSEEDLNINNLKIDKSNIIIFHTHTCESYTSSEEYTYTPTGNFRTTDLKYSVARVGDELARYLKKYNINVVHNKNYHDYPSYNGSYSRSFNTVSKLLEKTKADIIIDLHRDAIGNNSEYAPTVKIGEDICSQIMFVIGSDGGGLKHPNWKDNLKFAVKMQQIGNKTYPGLFKPIILRNSRYNQNLGKAACIIEVGATGNTLEQCLNSMKYLAEIMNEF